MQIQRSIVLALFSALALGPLACNSAHPLACPGRRVGTLNFKSTGVAGGTCPFAPQATMSPFTATVAFDGDSNAYLCLDRLEAEPLQGTRDGNHIALFQRSAATTVSACACDLTVDETLEGEVVLADDGSVVSFAGVLSDAVKPADGNSASCEPEAGSDGGTCSVPCEMTWDVNGTP